MINLGGFFAFVFAIAWIGVVIYIIMLFSRFVSAHERVADALDKMAGNPQDTSKP
jgi:hypothetical protein